ncbi:MAG: hypothetical protein KKH94_05520, partial [Candidatus Omnitrophica bacterium]|nr:hypothetical protein [Candidatus Omnitrophota bacterium]
MKTIERDYYRIAQIFFFWLFVISFVVFTPIVLLFSLGYTFDYTSNIFVKTGALRLKTLPDAAHIYCKKASKLARSLIKRYGMSEKLGPIAFGDKEELIFLGKEIGEQRNYSEKIATQIDEEVSLFMKKAKTTARIILKKRRGLLNKIATTLAEKENIERKEYEALLKPT